VRGNDHGQCLAEETLTEYLEGVLDPPLKAASEVHLISCDACRDKLGFFMRLLDQEATEQESHNLQLITAEWDRRKTDRQLPRSTGTFPAWFLGFIGVAAALILGIVSVRFVMERQSEPKSAGEVVRLLLAQQRPFESQMADEPHIPLVARTRSAEAPGFSYGLVASEMTRLSADSHQMGRFYLLQKDFPKSIPYLEFASREPGATADVHNDLGVAYLESGDPLKVDQAESEFQKALGLDPTFAAAAFNLALFYEHANQPAEAGTQWKRYLELDPKSAWAKEAQERLKGLTR
jgi:tetratricopeptide (TPR) repeat protein